MTTNIGKAAGQVWQYLNSTGDSTISKIAKETGLSRPAAERALGWLAREDKLTFEKAGRSEMIRLR